MDLQLLYQFLSGFIVLYCLIIFLYLYRKNTLKKNELFLKKYTFDFCNNDKTNYEEYIVNSIRKEYNKKEVILKILTQFDKISIGLKHEIFVEQIIYDYYGKYFIDFYNENRFFIIQRRETSSNPDLFIEYEILVRRWDSNLNILNKI